MSVVKRYRGDDGKQHVDALPTAWNAIKDGLEFWKNGGPSSKKPSALTGPNFFANPKRNIKNAVASAPKSKGNLFNNTVQTVGRATGESNTEIVKSVQQILRNHGYNITVDGIQGPQTESALQDFHSSRGNSKKWNTAHVPTTKSTVPPVSDNGPLNTDAHDRVTSSADTSSKTDTSSVVKKILGSLDDTSRDIDPSKYQVNPKQYAQAAANEEYNPQINQAKKSISDATAQAKTNQADLSKWFGDASSLTSAGAQQASQMEQADQSNQAKAAAGILAAFGGNAGGAGDSIANTAQIGANQLAGEASATDAFNKMLTGLVADQGATAKTTQQNQDEKNIGDMKTALMSLVAAKAANLTKGTADATNQNLSNLLGITNANNATDANNLNKTITEAELPYTLQGAALANKDKQSTIDKNAA